MRLVVVVAIALCACKSARDYAVKKYDERRVVEKAEEQAAADQAAKDEAERPAVQAPNGPGLAPGRYRLTDVWVTAFATNGKGRPWDDAPNVEPDLLVKIRLDDGKAHECKPPDDAAGAHCKLDLEIELQHGSKIELEVIDRDSVIDDPIGTAALADPSHWSVGTELQMLPRQRVKSASIALATVPAWWELHRNRVLGLGIGIGLALLVLGLFRGALLRKTEPETDAIWHVPVLVIAGLSALAGIGVAIGVETNGLPEPYGSAIQWALAAASLVFTLARVVRTGRVGRRELELVLVAGGIFIAHYMLIIAGAAVAIGIGLMLLDELS